MNNPSTMSRVTPPPSVDAASDFIHSAIDAARWVAFQRASETTRPDAVIIDHFASRFVGRQPPSHNAVECRVAFRAACIDQLIIRMIADLHLDTVINLGAGFDTRPQRLRLPATLRWIEIDDQSVLQEKAAALTDAPARCALERVAANLDDSSNRSWLNLTPKASTLVVTEGVLAYLTPPQVRALALALREAGVKAWVTDVTAPLFVAAYRNAFAVEGSLSQLLRFTPADPIGFFARCGFRCDEFVSVERLLEQAKRARPFADAPEPLRQMLLDASGVLTLLRADH